MDEQWYAAGCHLERLVKRHPEDAELAADLARAQAYLQVGREAPGSPLPDGVFEP
jgi:hypothetical protein